MKVKTNLSPAELHKVGSGLMELSKSQLTHEYIPENNAEKELLRKMNSTFVNFADELQTLFADVLLEKTV